MVNVCEWVGEWVAVRVGWGTAGWWGLVLLPLSRAQSSEG